MRNDEGLQRIISGKRSTEAAAFSDANKSLESWDVRPLMFGKIARSKTRFFEAFCFRRHESHKSFKRCRTILGLDGKQRPCSSNSVRLGPSERAPGYFVSAARCKSLSLQWWQSHVLLFSITSPCWWLSHRFLVFWSTYKNEYQNYINFFFCKHISLQWWQSFVLLNSITSPSCATDFSRFSLPTNILTKNHTFKSGSFCKASWCAMIAVTYFAVHHYLKLWSTLNKQG